MGPALVGGTPGAFVRLSMCTHAYGLQCVHTCMTCVTWGSAHGQGRPSTLTAGRCHLQGPRLDPELDLRMQTVHTKGSALGNAGRLTGSTCDRASREPQPQRLRASSAAGTHG